MSVLLNTTTTIGTITTAAAAVAAAVSNETLIWKFSNQYRLVHGWASAICCLFGIPCNLLNIIVLTQPNMIKSPTNLILVGLAFTDLLTMIAYLPQCIYFYILRVNYKTELHPDKDTLFWTHFQKNFIMFTVTVHSISIWLTVYLACYRYVFLRTSSPTGHSQYKSPRLIAIKKATEDFFISCRSYNSTIGLMIFISLFCVTFCIPAYLYPQVLSKEFIAERLDNLNVSNHNQTKEYVYYIAESYLAKKSNGTIWKSMFYSQAIFAKLVPCLLLVTFTLLLIKSLVIINRNKMKLEKMCSYPRNDPKNPNQVRQIPKKKKTNKDKGTKKNRASENLRTTLMLVVVCLLFLVTEFPQCMLLICSLIFSNFYKDTYTPLGDLMDILALFNNSINFLLYCTMSKAFRDTFYKIISKYFCLESSPQVQVTQASLTNREHKTRRIFKEKAHIELDENKLGLLTQTYEQNATNNNINEYSNGLNADSKI